MGIMAPIICYASRVVGVVRGNVCSLVGGGGEKV